MKMWQKVLEAESFIYVHMSFKHAIPFRSCLSSLLFKQRFFTALKMLLCLD